MLTGKICEIDVHVPNTWESKCFVTIDLDWANDRVIEDTLNLLAGANIKSTWFITHYTPLLEQMFDNPLIEIGIHPNFNKLMEGDVSNGVNSKDVIQRLVEIVPGAKSIRSHSMTQNSRLLDLFKSFGLTHDCNHYIPHQTGLELMPWDIWNGLIRVPFFWEDDIEVATNTSDQMQTLIGQKGLRVFNFHPIHIYLNTESLDRYEKCRNFHKDPTKLYKFRNESVFGTRDKFKSLISNICGYEQ